jgi:predicted SAM-dependent methyltransferase
MKNLPLVRPAGRLARSLLGAARTRLAIARGGIDKVEIGSGPARGRNGWTTLDMHGADLSWNLAWGLPFADGSLSKIYSSHVMEHFPYDALIGLLRECLRALRPGGVYSAAVPNAALYVESYVRRDLSKLNMQYPPALRSELAIDALNYVAYMDGQHLYMFDGENLQRVLRVAGFAEVRLRAFDPALDRKERDHESIYVEAVKAA